jgi:hypothetical protein
VKRKTTQAAKSDTDGIEEAVSPSVGTAGRSLATAGAAVVFSGDLKIQVSRQPPLHWYQLHPAGPARFDLQRQRN